MRKGLVKFIGICPLPLNQSWAMLSFLTLSRIDRSEIFVFERYLKFIGSVRSIGIDKRRFCLREDYVARTAIHSTTFIPSILIFFFQQLLRRIEINLIAFIRSKKIFLSRTSSRTPRDRLSGVQLPTENLSSERASLTYRDPFQGYS